MTIIYFLILLSVIIVIHELGHLITAKIFKVYCYEFSIGMGPKLFQKKGKETAFTIRLIPMGGYVAMAGENDGTQEDHPEIVVPPERTIGGVAWWKRTIIMLAGVTMNFLLAWIICSMVFLSNGAYAESPRAEVAGVVENSPAEVAGLQEGDIIKEVVFEDGTDIKPTNFYDILNFSQTYGGEMTYTIDRNGQTLQVSLTGEKGEDGLYYVGIYMPEREVKQITLLNCWGFGANYLVDTTRTLLTSIVRLFHGNGLDQLSGPVGIYNATSETASLGIKYFMLLIALLSLNVGIFNLLPLPVLDGGRAIITIGEAIIGKKLNPKVETALMAACWVLLIGLMVFATWNDIARLLG